MRQKFNYKFPLVLIWLGVATVGPFYVAVLIHGYIFDYENHKGAITGILKWFFSK